MGIISPHIVHYGKRGRSTEVEGEPRYRCLGCREEFGSVHRDRVCPECSGYVGRIPDDGT